MMRTKNRLKILILVFIPMLFFSCKNEQELFDKDANIRVESKLDNLREILTSSKQGWLLKMYPSADLKYGGFNIFMQFDANGNVKASNELFNDPSALVDSHYNLRLSDDAIISFDTYNSAIHMFSEPDSRYFTSSRPKGADGDFIFKIISVNKDMIELRGLRNNNKIEMIPLKEHQNGIDVLKKMQEIDRDLNLVKFALKYDNQSIEGFTSSRFGRVLSLKNGQNIPFMYTDKGIELYTAYKFGNISAKDFILEDINGRKILKSESSKVEIERIELSLAEKLILGNWYTADNLIPRYKAIFGTIQSTVKRVLNPNASVVSLRLASSSSPSEGNGFGIWGDLFMGSSGSNTLEFFIPLEYTLFDDAPNEIEFSYPGKEKAGSVSHALSNNLLFKFYAFPFANIGSIPQVNWNGNKNPRKFTIVDDKELAKRFQVPAVFVLTEKKDHTNVIHLILNTQIDAYQPTN